ncbi:MAG TPA: nucleotidyltransferase family protein [Ktedonobacterales bacterium]|jgi:molybdenum cofactor cytidylyltransferase|nr:nucleotidyltransferase family protein [Ktedonobacterales bacterium]
MQDSATFAAIVLAAGQSSRMGGHKLLLPLGDRPLIAHAIAAACASSANPVIVVLGHDAARVAAALPSGRKQVIVNPDYQEGMSTSLRVGLADIPLQAAGVLILLGDQPLVTVELVEQMLEAARESPESILAASYAGRRGNPVYFPRAYFEELRMVTGDEGGRSVIQQHLESVRLVPVAIADAALDADSPDDYQRILAAWERQSSTGNG